MRKTIETIRSNRWSWELRCAAMLMLEYQLLSADAGELASFFGDLGLLRNSNIHERVLEEGYTTTDLCAFAAQFRARLSRLERVHRAICGFETTPGAMEDFIYTSRRECKLTLARYLFDSDEVAARVLEFVRRTDGLPKRMNAPALEEEELKRERPERISSFDQKLASRLRGHHRVLWVCERTSSEINSLVEYPLTTVALAIKPPGSDLEFEVKRAGMRGDYPLDIVFERSGKQVPPFHRLQGASSGSMLDFEAWAGHRFRNIYLGAHGAEPPMSRMLGMTSISNVPREPKPVHLLEYFSNRASFGADFERMQTSLRQSVENYEGNEPQENLPGAVGWTVRFLSRTVPNQAWLAGTSSFRLDRTADLLSPGGPELYFRQGLNRAFTPAEARRLADELLEEVLGVYDPPVDAPEDYREYVSAALAYEPNRARANAIYRSCLCDIGLYWGTLLAFGGFTEGESFVTRNVGLKSRWREGEWVTRICFMDHDGLRAPGSPGDWPHPSAAIEGMRKDHDWICGADNNRSELACLHNIYATGGGDDLFLKSVAQGYRATRSAMKNSSAVKSMFDPDYVRTLDLRDEVIRRFLANPEDLPEHARTVMEPTVYPADWIPGMCEAIVRNRRTLERYLFLYNF